MAQQVRTRSRSYVFTSFKAEEPMNLDTNVKYMIYQQEICPETKKAHWQGMIELFTPIGLKSVQKIIDDTKAHVEQTRNREKSREYCRKKESAVEGTQYEWGEWEPVGQGRRSDFSTIYDAIKSNKPMREIIDANPGTFARYHRGISQIRRIMWGRRLNKDCEVTILWGKSGAGKTHEANKRAPNAYWKDNTKWWDGYNGEDEVIINDMMLAKWEPDYLKNLFDKWPMKIEDKGGVMELIATKFVITTNENPEVWFNHIPELKRRIKNIIEYKDEYRPPAKPEVVTD